MPKKLSGNGGYPPPFVSFEYYHLFLERTKAKRGCGVNIPFPSKKIVQWIILNCTAPGKEAR